MLITDQNRKIGILKALLAESSTYSLLRLHGIIAVACGHCGLSRQEAVGALADTLGHTPCIYLIWLVR